MVVMFTCRGSIEANVNLGAMGPFMRLKTIMLVCPVRRYWMTIPVSMIMSSPVSKFLLSLTQLVVKCVSWSMTVFVRILSRWCTFSPLHDVYPLVPMLMVPFMCSAM